MRGRLRTSATGDDAFAAGMRVNISEWLYVVYEYLSLIMGGLRLIMCLINGSYC
ncbi:hypothetical protein HMPREF0240_00373 [Clostridium sp. D5]|nr:hypothetical protein HMPREF0240_00373 [Clostridium sp. D5]